MKHKLATLVFVTSVTFGFVGDAMAHGNCPPEPKREQPITDGFNNRVSPEPKRVNCPTCVEPTEPTEPTTPTDDDNPGNNPTEPNDNPNTEPNVKPTITTGYTVYMPIMFATDAQHVQRITRIGGR